jgi:N-acetylmuramoyl-L-alanine amidase
LLEKDVVLEVARKFSALIQQNLGVRVVLTRSGDFTLPLPERTAIANNAKAQLFISLHLEGDFRRESGGIRVFTLGASPLVKPRETPRRAKGNLEAILWDMAQTEHLNESNRFADLVAEALARETELPAPAVREVPLMVLRGAQMPAVLVSLAYLTNPKEQSLLDKEEFLEKMATGLFEAVKNFAQGRNDIG